MGNVEAGWYDDGSGNQRWWDGDRWTDDYADMTGTRGRTPQLATDAARPAGSRLVRRSSRTAALVGWPAVDLSQPADR
ncbi:DUF2510 domain-containing protein [Microbacterium sp. DT81.1]|uniref:DUF2510 domain-containing protein n=1 Tax=Microbacterium sp. DT81.1 TaxID=3393413 RepID=UPI003CEC6BD9